MGEAERDAFESEFRELMRKYKIHKLKVHAGRYQDCSAYYVDGTGAFSFEKIVVNAPHRQLVPYII